MIKKITFFIITIISGFLSAQTPSLSASPGVGGSITQIGPNGSGGFIFYDASNNPVDLTITANELSNAGSNPNSYRVYLSIRNVGDGATVFATRNFDPAQSSTETNIQEITFGVATEATFNISDRVFILGMNDYSLDEDETNTLVHNTSYSIWIKHWGYQESDPKYGNDAAYPANDKATQSFFATYNSSLTLNTKNNDKLNTSLSIYPNPASNTLHITNNQLSEYYQVMNCLGEVILETRATEKIDVSSLSKGVYFLKNDVETLKFIKE